MSWLARLEVDAEAIYSAGISKDIYTWHKMLWQCYPNAPDRSRSDIGFLTRIDQLEGAYRFWVMAEEQPVRPPWCPAEGFVVKEISPSFLSHQFYAFDLIANPVKTLIKRGPNGETLYQRTADGDILYRSDGKPKRAHGKRIPIVKPEELRAWLIRKAQVRCLDKDRQDVPGGFRIVEREDRPLEIRPMVESHFRKKDKTNNKEYSAYHGGVQFRGILEVTDQKSFEESYHAGIGSAKSFGFGLLLLAPVKI